MIFNEIRVAGADIRVWMVEQNLRLRPMDEPISFHAAGNPSRIAVGVVRPLAGQNGLAAVVVIPEQILSVAEFLTKLAARGCLIGRPPGS